jgi:hypothetical protein
MKRYIIILLFPVVSILALGCSIDEELKDKSDRFDFRQTNWGANHERVKGSESSAPTDENTDVITYVGEFEGMPAIVGYLFQDEKLTRAGYVMTKSYQEPEMYVRDFNKLRDFYTMTYGKPSYDMVNWNEDAQSNIKTDAYAQVACDGDVQYLAGWGTQGSMVRLMLHGKDGKCELGVMYESLRFYVGPEMKKKE